MNEIADFSALRLLQAIRKKEVSPVEAVKAALDRIDQRSELNAFITVCSDRALKEAKIAEADIMSDKVLGPLHGLPFSVKDLTLTEGIRTTQGSSAFAENIPNADAIAVARARKAGAILIGKTTTPEFGHKPFTEGPLFGRTLNPWSNAHTCGGSSGGAAVAITTGMGQLALGSDGGGSIRIPASCCGVVGLKATLGTIPNLQAPDLFGANSYVGPMARDIADTVLFYNVLSGGERNDPYGQIKNTEPRRLQKSEKVRIALLMRCGNILASDVENTVKKAIIRAEELGYIIEPIELDFVSLEPHFLVFLRSLLLARLGRQIEKRPDLFDPTLITTIEAGRKYTAVDLHEAQFARTSCFRAVQDVFTKNDIIISPTLASPPLPVGLDPHGNIQIDGHDVGTLRGGWYPYTYPFNLTGHPALSMPCGISKEGLPIGLQLVGQWHQDAFLLDVAGQLERALS
ncbi:MAG: amidase [Beijerinckiaceae bacterium]|nr:amidase [Beijerinckiaceae bacterium]